MLAQRIATILPPLNLQESLKTTPYLPPDSDFSPNFQKPLADRSNLLYYIIRQKGLFARSYSC
jgi:predicted ATPase with chaperone activity